MRAAFSGLVSRPTFLFRYERGDHIDESLLERLERAREEGGLTLAPPTPIKSFALKFLELSREVAQASALSLCS